MQNISNSCSILIDIGINFILKTSKKIIKMQPKLIEVYIQFVNKMGTQKQACMV